jgi:hypothetical protein
MKRIDPRYVFVGHCALMKHSQELMCEHEALTSSTKTSGLYTSIISLHQTLSYLLVSKCNDVSMSQVNTRSIEIIHYGSNIRQLMLW